MSIDFPSKGAPEAFALRGNPANRSELVSSDDIAANVKASVLSTPGRATLSESMRGLRETDYLPSSTAIQITGQSERSPGYEPGSAQDNDLGEFAQDFQSHYDLLHDEKFTAQRLPLAFVPTEGETEDVSSAHVGRQVGDSSHSNDQELDNLMRGIALESDGIRELRCRVLSHLVNLPNAKVVVGKGDPLSPLATMNRAFACRCVAKLIDETLSLEQKDVFTDRDITTLKGFSQDLHLEARHLAGSSLDDGQPALTATLKAEDILPILSGPDARTWTTEGGWTASNREGGVHSTRIAFAPFERRDESTASMQHMLRVTVYDMADTSRGNKGRAVYGNERSAFSRPTTYEMSLEDFTEFFPKFDEKASDLQIKFREQNQIFDRGVEARLFYNNLHQEFPDIVTLLSDDHPSVSILPQQTESYCTFDSKFAFLRDALSEKGFFNFTTLVSLSASSNLDDEDLLNPSDSSEFPRTQGYAFNIDDHVGRVLEGLDRILPDDQYEFIDQLMSYYDHSLTGHVEVLRNNLRLGIENLDKLEGDWKGAPTASPDQTDKLRGKLLEYVEALKPLNALQRIHENKRSIWQETVAITEAGETLANQVQSILPGLGSEDRGVRDQAKNTLRALVGDSTQLADRLEHLQMERDSLYASLDDHIETYHPEHPGPASLSTLKEKTDDGIAYAEHLVRNLVESTTHGVSSKNQGRGLLNQVGRRLGLAGRSPS